ncbi:hypothetical protein PBY51_019551 [Eleginops maclovinus]|uniref:Uncharacterized protein n=1 Tax=Eleginops maclovinus TaxID=56733 RepID=A0AAN7Y2K5_ELEMC|nr:hypothetical protein PBY51_019551 [Eleginops maclovinus]
MRRRRRRRLRHRERCTQEGTRRTSEVRGRLISRRWWGSATSRVAGPDSRLLSHPLGRRPARVDRWGLMTQGSGRRRRRQLLTGAGCGRRVGTKKHTPQCQFR